MRIPWGVKRKCKSGGVILKMAAAQGEYILPIFPIVSIFGNADTVGREKEM
jgi:hypothetical protein